MYASIGVTVTPSRAWRTPGSTSRENGIEPKRSAASQSPAGTPGTPHDAGPMLNTCGASSNRISIATSSPRADGSRPRPPASTKKSSNASSPAAVCASRKPPPPSAVSGLSTASEASTAQIAASNALPPSRRTSAPASAVSRMPGSDNAFLMC